MGLPKELLDMLACPQCKGKLKQNGESLLCEKCSKEYPIQDGIPILT
ncbi:MAG TPA: Trm112 family protein [Candidatus Nanoarchaeia archaeon]|nr:Trm112 family protein [Candidatus Nanoarchaeia archaeon]